MCGFVKPHHPFDPPAPWDKMVDPDGTELLPGWSETLSEFDAQTSGYFPNTELTTDVMRRVTAYYYATISQIDFHIGRMIEHLKARGIYQNTVIVFASDHGEYLGFHHLLLKSGAMYNPLVRVPLLIKFAGNARGGTRETGLTTLTDLAPTLLQTAGIGAPVTMKGRDLSAPGGAREFVFADDKRGQIVMARSERYKLLWSPDETQRRFFDLQTDPLETTNLLDDKNCAREIARHRAALANWALFEAVPPNFLDPNAPLAPNKFANAGDVAAVGGAQRDDEQRESARAWSAKKFAEYLAGA